MLVRTLGHDQALRFVRACGGSRVWIPVPGREPRRNPVNRRILRAIGTEAFDALRAACGGDYLQVPLALPTGECVCERIMELHRRGKSMNEIARAAGRHLRTVYKWLGKDITRPHRFSRLRRLALEARR